MSANVIDGVSGQGGPIDLDALDALLEYVEDHTPIAAALDGRIAVP